MNTNLIGYIHTKTIPGCSPELIDKLGKLVDRMSINIELPSNDSLKLLAPEKSKTDILKPMKYVSDTIHHSKELLSLPKHQWGFHNSLVPKTSSTTSKTNFKSEFVPAGQTTQLIVGATPETDLKIIKLSEGLYQQLKLKRVYYSAYISVNQDKNLPTLSSPPLLRENRLYQADWLLRFYGFKADELLSENQPNFNTLLDPKCDWALRNIDQFPIEINTAGYYTLLRIPGVGIVSAKRIITARREHKLNFDILKKLGVVLKRARYFITCNGKYYDKVQSFNRSFIQANLLYLERKDLPMPSYYQTSIFDNLLPTKGDQIKCLTGNL